MPIKVPAAANRPVSSLSSGLGEGSPDGWLWKTTIAAAPPRAASRNTSRGWTTVEFKVPIATRLLRDLALRWRLGSTSWPLSFVGSGSFSATQLHDRVVVCAELRITQYLLTRGALFGLVSGGISAFSGAIPALVFGAAGGLGIGAVCYALAKWEFGFWFQRLDRLLEEGRQSRRLTSA